MIGDIVNGLRLGYERLFQAPQGYRVEAILPPVLPHYPKGLLVLVADGNSSQESPDPELDRSQGPSSERLDALVEATCRHRTQSRAVIAMLGLGS